MNTPVFWHPKSWNKCCITRTKPHNLQISLQNNMKLRLCSNSSTPIAPVSYHIRMLKTYIMQYLILTTAIFSVIYTGTHYCSILSSHQSCKDAVYTTPSFRKLHSQNQRMLKPAKLPTQATVDDRRKLILKQSRLYSSTIHQYAFHH